MRLKQKARFVVGALALSLVAILIFMWLSQLYVASLGPGDAKDISAALQNSHGIVVSASDILEYDTAVGRDPAVFILVATPRGAQTYYNANFPAASFKTLPGSIGPDFGIPLGDWLDMSRLRIISSYEHIANSNLIVTLIDDPLRGEVILIQLYDLIEVELLR